MLRPPRVALLSALALLLSLPLLVRAADVLSATDGIERGEGGTGKKADHDEHDDTDTTAAGIDKGGGCTAELVPDFPVENGLLVLTQDNFIQAAADQLEASEFYDAVLILLVIYSPTCPHCQPVLKDLEDASDELCRAWDEAVTSPAYPWGADDSAVSPPPRPLLGKMDGTEVDGDFLRGTFGTVEGYPALKFAILQLDEEGEGGRDEDKDEDEDGDDIYGDVLIDVFDYVGPLDDPTAADLAGSMLHYWYRYVGARRMASELSLLRELDPQKEDGSGGGGGGYYYAEHNVPVFVVPSDAALVSFASEHGDGFLRPVAPTMGPPSDRAGEEEREYVASLLKPPDDEPDLAEPVTLFVQCRLGDGGRGDDGDAYMRFDDLADEMSARRDVAFFAVHPPQGRGCTNGGGKEVDGSVAVIRLHKAPKKGTEGGEGDTTMEWTGFDGNGGVALYVPPQTAAMDGEIGGRDDDAEKKNRSGSELTLTQFVVCQSTPPLLWFDRGATAPYAFPVYRRVHAVLFIDMHRAGKHAPRGELTASQSRAAVRMFRRAAVDHRRRRPMDDVVFLVVPSTEVRVMTTFGIDIWTQLDEALVADADGEPSCSAGEIVLPTVMLTSRVSPTDGEMKGLKRYYLPANDLLPDLESDEKNSAALSQFIDDYFDGKLTPSIKSQAEPTNRTNESGVQIVTGNSFQSLVMDQKERHTLVLFYAPTCGHCKRFAVVWNELSRLVRALHWDEIVDVMKMDLTRNEVTHDGLLDIWSFPSVYYFPANGKDNPIKMAVKGDEKLKENNLGSVNSAYDLVDWLVGQGYLDERELLSLHEMGSASIEEGQTTMYVDGADEGTTKEV